MEGGKQGDRCMPSRDLLSGALNTTVRRVFVVKNTRQGAWENQRRFQVKFYMDSLSPSLDSSDGGKRLTKAQAI